MANITLSTTESNIVVDSTNNIITVSSTPTTVIVGETATVSNADIRAAISNTAPITYNNTTGVIGIDSSAILTGKTTTDLPEGANLYYTTARFNTAFSLKTTDNLSEGSTNLYYSNTRFNASFAAKTTDDLPQGTFNFYATVGNTRNALSVSNTIPSALTNLSYDSTTGIFYYTGLSNTGLTDAIRDNNVKLKLFSETVYNKGNISGNVNFTASLGSIQNANLVGNVTSITLPGIQQGGTMSLILKQDAIGYRRLDTTTFPSAWTDWEFVGDHTTLTVDPNAYDILTVTYDGTKYFASLVNFNSPVIQNNQLANSNVVVNGTTISLGSSGNISHFGALTTSNLPEGTNLYYTDARANSAIAAYTAANPITVGGNLTVNGNINATGNINYQNVTDLYVTDQKITLNSNAATNANVEIISNRPTATNTMLKWNEQSTRWEFTNDGTTYYAIATSTTDLAEGTNQYFTTARANTAMDNYLVGGTGISYTAGTVALDFSEFDTGNITEGTNLYYTTDRANTAIADKLIDSTQKLVFNAAVQDLYLTSNASSPSGGYYMPNVPGSVGDVLQLTGGDQANWQRLDTGDVDEGANLYYTTDRANTAIGAYQGSISTPGNITAGNVITAAIHSNGSNDITLNSNTKVVVKETIKGVSTNVGNIDGKGYAIYQASVFDDTPRISYSGSGNITLFATNGVTTAGSNTITGVTQLIEAGAGAPPGSFRTIDQLLPNTFFYNASLGSVYPFPNGTKIVSIDAANNSVIMSEAATANVTFNLGQINFAAGMHDSSTGLTVLFQSQFDVSGNGTGSRSTIATTYLATPSTPIYGYPSTGFTINDFDVYTYDTASNYSIVGDLSNFFIGKTEIEAPKTFMNFPRGLAVGNTDLTGRGEGDSIPVFGINVLWDNTANVAAEYAGLNPGMQLLMKKYSDYTDATLTASEGPRLFFTASKGNKNIPYAETYLRQNSEIGRITWWNGAQSTAASGLSTLAAPAYISAVTNRDMTGTHNGGVGMYLSASPNNNAGRRGLFAAHQLGTTLIASSNTTTTGASQPIVFAPMYTNTTATTAGNAVFMFDNTLAATNYQWANINYDNATAKTGSKLSVTNGISNVSARNGNIVIALDRNDNGVGFGNKAWALKLQSGNSSLVMTEDDVIRTTFAPGGNVDITGNINLTGRLMGYDSVYGEFCYTGGNITPAAADTIYAFPLDTTNFNSDVNANNTSRINITKSGRFKLITSIQVKNADNANDHIMRFWLRKNGVDVANSATLITPLKLQEQVVAMDWMVESDGDDYFEIVYYVNDTDVTFPYYAAGTTPVTYPAAPPIIVNVIPVGA